MEQNSQSFEIERSLDGESFETLGKVEARGGKGTHSNQETYTFEDETLGLTRMPRAFYRVRQIGLDGRSHYTDVVEHDLGMDLGLYAAILEEAKSPFLNIRYAGDREGEMTLRVFRLSGEIMVEKQLMTEFVPDMVTLEIEGWEKGIYLLQLANDNTTLMEQFEVK